MTIDLVELEAYLHRVIPISREMGVRVEAVDETGVRLFAPLAPNINHRNTAFGGSVATVATLSAWMLVHARLREAGSQGRVVIQRSSMEYLHPIHGDFGAFCRAPEPAAWDRFMDTLARRGVARISLHSEVLEDGRAAGRFHGAFVAATRSAGEK
jgi:thioesterase domain-containing protein